MSFEMTKIFGWVLASMILAIVSGIVASVLVHPQPLAQPAYMVATASPAAETVAAAKAGGQPAAAKAEQGGVEPVEPLLATASVDEGKNRSRICNTCHSFDKGGVNKIGPNLYGTVGEPIAEGHDGYSFSPALSAHKGEKWTVDELNQWLAKPQAFAKGTKMSFPGFANAKDRADVIAYLNSLSDSPKPLAGK